MIPSHQDLVVRDLVDVAAACAAAEGVTVERMFSREKWASLVRARRRFYVHLRDLGWSLPAIGRFVGRDHVTILYALRGGRPRVKSGRGADGHVPMRDRASCPRCGKSVATCTHPLVLHAHHCPHGVWCIMPARWPRRRRRRAGYCSTCYDARQLPLFMDAGA